MKKEKSHFQDYKDILKPPKEGITIKGKVIEKTKKGVFLDLEDFKVGFIRREDLSLAGKNISKIKNGDEILSKIIDLENDEGYTDLSLVKAREDSVWKNIEDIRDKNEELCLKVQSANKGGLILSLDGCNGFLPASQLSEKNYPKVKNPTPEKIFEELKKFVGEEMKVRIIKIDTRTRKLILSEKIRV